ncbi:MAG TPA: hypothetical protein VK624_02180, partial [Steroidobacteraceae bacterium]|nr:hypothetical protein [Steroidobacteraceae bacterium]
QRPFRALSDRCIHECWMRGHFAAHIETVLDLMWKRVGASVPERRPMPNISWLPTAYDVAARFTANGRGRSNLYLIPVAFGDFW